ncbi:hypothetical protein [Homoserinimonas sp. OAct 916]|uniref:hypothetical protein n=1 Tax=Homoserinimonas sp. OAct 916 TaxID=2211450 RepID=UPI000DBE5E91|nr:hypothetical protein [Homoserinimonas sp. OAct 916]
MKFSRIIASTGAVALVAASVLLGAGVAQAADYFVTADDFGVEGDSYPQGWFVGDMGPQTGSIQSTPDGLEITGPLQILNGTTPSTDILGLVGNDLDLRHTGTATFQIPVYTGTGANGFTTFRPAPSTLPWNPNGDWITSQAWGGYAKGATASLTEFAAAMDPGYTILAFGLFVNAGDVVTVQQIEWAGDTHYFVPGPTGVFDISVLSLDDLRKNGVSVTFTNLPKSLWAWCNIVAGEYEAIDWPNLDDEDFISKQQIDLNEDGSLTVTYQPGADVELADGPYTVACFTSEVDSALNTAHATFTIAEANEETPVPPADEGDEEAPLPPADEGDEEAPALPVDEGDEDESAVPVVAAPKNATPALAATGVDGGPLALAAFLLVLGGLGVTAVATRRTVSAR